MTLIQLFTNIANAIRNKKGTTGKIKAEDFASEISTITTGENLDTELNAQDTAIAGQTTDVNSIITALDNIGESKYNVTIDPTKVLTNTSTSSSSYILNQCITEIKVDWLNACTNWTSMANLFYKCTNLLKINLDGLDTQNITNMSNLFGYNTKIEEININSLNTPKLTNCNYMFTGCSALKKIYMKNFNPTNITSSSSMFNGVPTTCEIITNQTMATWLNTNFPTYTNITIVTADWEV